MSGAAVLAGGWAALVMLVFVRRRPPPARVMVMARSRPAVRRRPGRLSLLTALGGLVLRLVGRPTNDPTPARRVGAGTLLAVTFLALAPKATPMALFAGWAVPVAASRRRRRRRQREVAAALPEVVDLLAVAVGAGLTVGHAIEAVGRHASNPVAQALAELTDEVAVGRRLADALDDLPVRLGEEVRPLSGALAGCERYGTAVVPVLVRLGDQLRADQRRLAEAAARRVPVKLLFPLVICILPAFALLTVAPLIASALQSLRL
ncbi:MAG: tight adherence protein [Acidimicrobiaceae bacterium]|nr:tight adherence protein [Acidimicrobiaceae bacterium]